MTTASDRLPLTVQFTPGKDDDLIALIASLPKGKRNGQVKALLRAGAEKQRQGDELANLRAEQGRITAAIEALTRQLASGVIMQTSEPPIEAAPAITAEQKARRAQRLKAQSWD